MKRIYLLILFVFSSSSYAEHCWMTGACLNEVGYVIVPESHYKNNNGDTGKINGKPYIVEGSKKIFEEGGVPLVGNEYTINTNYYELLGTYEFKRDIESVSKWYKTRKASEWIWSADKSSAKLKLNVTQYREGNQLGSGTKVKILSLRLLKEEIPHISQQHILALVQVVSEPEN